MKSIRIITGSLMGLVLLAGLALAANADVSGSVLNASGLQSEAEMVVIQPEAAGEELNGRGGGGKPPKNPTATPEPTATPVGCVGCPEMHVSFITVSYGSTQDTYGSCRVGIVDASENLLEGVEVTMELTAPFAGQYVDTTVERNPGYGNYQAQVVQRKSGRNACGKRGNPETMTCTVVGVYHPDYTYTPSLNVETSDTDSCADGPVSISH